MPDNTLAWRDSSIPAGVEADSQRPVAAPYDHGYYLIKTDDEPVLLAYIQAASWCDDVHQMSFSRHTDIEAAMAAAEQYERTGKVN